MQVAKSEILRTILKFCKSGEDKLYHSNKKILKSNRKSAQIGLSILFILVKAVIKTIYIKAQGDASAVIWLKLQASYDLFRQPPDQGDT